MTRTVDALSMDDHEFVNVSEAHSDKGDISDLFSSFDYDYDSKAQNKPSGTPPQQQSEDKIPSRFSSPSSSASQLGYVTMSRPRNGIKRQHFSADTHASDSLTRSEIPLEGAKKKRRTISSSSLSPSTSSLLFPFPLPPDNNDQTSSPQSPSSSPRNLPSDVMSEPTTPTTRRFNDRMLSLLSLLPTSRYSHSSPSISGDQHEESEMSDCDLDLDVDARAPSPVFLAHISAVENYSEDSPTFTISQPIPLPGRPAGRIVRYGEDRGSDNLGKRA